MGSVQINGDSTAGQRANRAYTISTTGIGVYMRIKFPVVGSSTWSVALAIDSASSEQDLILNGGGSSIQWNNNGTQVTIFGSVSSSSWYDIFIRRNGSNVDVYYKLSTDSIWSLTS